MGKSDHKEEPISETSAKRKSYSSDLSTGEHEEIRPHIPQPKKGGRPAEYDRVEIVNAVRYLLRTGCSWRLLPHDFPPWGTVYHYFSVWRRDGTWERIHGTLRDRLREAEGREAEPSAAIIDSQSVKTTEKGGSMGMMPGRKSTDESGICL
jgi:putative transposase